MRYNRTGGLLEITTTSDDGRSTLTVANDGPIVADDSVPALFERFHRGARTSGGGFGLGLAIADAIARGHGGRLELEPRAQGGLVVRASLPAARVPLPARTESQGSVSLPAEAPQAR